MQGRLGIAEVSPIVGNGTLPARAVVGEQVPVTATIWREGHEAMGATLVLRCAGHAVPMRTQMTCENPGLDRWRAVFVPDRPGEWTFWIEAWGDPWTTWRDAMVAKLAAGRSASELANDLVLGERLILRAAGRHSGRRSAELTTAAQALARSELPLADRTGPALGSTVDAHMRHDPIRELLTRSSAHPLLVERERALSGAWYEIFPRSTGGWDGEGRPRHGTLATTQPELERIAAMGFDVVYLPPIHPIGRVNRKGRNNSVPAEPGDVGSPWAVGAAEGGHDAVDPLLGTLDDFDRLVARATELGLEIAMDLALQCAPDHPWIIQHPDWFTRRPDGSIAYAENPPKQYEDIYPLNFDNDPGGLLEEVLRVVRFWISHGVRAFRVDNPHTKPLDFWYRLLARVRREHPDVIFLSEAFTRPAMMYGLARLGFSQSYTYFTWRTTKEELTSYFIELADTDALRPNLWVNTPDVLPAHLSGATPGVFASRAALAATLGPSWGMYSGYELYENVPVAAGSEEYLDSEKYELRPRDYGGAASAGRSLQPWITQLNRVRREHPALRQLRTLHFHAIDNDNLICYSKTDPDTRDAVLCVVALDVDKPQQGRLRLDRAALGCGPGVLRVRDEISGRRMRWRDDPVLRLEPDRAAAAIFSMETA